VDFGDRRLTVVEMDGRRISKVRVEPLEAKPQAAESTK
jgi:CBS domain containing-hemolysin-like protein